MLAVLTADDGRGGGRVQETASSLSQLSTQTVFSMLAHLTQWSRHVLSSKSKQSGETQFNSIQMSFNLHEKKKEGEHICS